MLRSAFGVGLGLALLGASPSSGQDRQAGLNLTADGTWDCKDNAGTSTGVVVLAEKTYAFIKADGSVGGYGKLFSIVEDAGLPTFAMMSGYLKDEVGSQGMMMRGPLDSPWDWSGQLYLNVIVTTEANDGSLDWECVRRDAITP